MITVDKVSKFFGLSRALNDVSFQIAKGEIVGFLGPNGAGKTTLMRILTGYFPPSQGKTTIAGYDIVKNPLCAKQSLGYLPENPPLYPEMSVADYLRYAAQLKGLNATTARSQIDKTLASCDIDSVRNKAISSLSKGFKQRVGIAQAIIHDPQVLILDEPTNGLDPLQIIQVRNLINNLGKEKTVLVSTHILSEIEQIAHRVVIISEGKIVADDSLANMLNGPQGKNNLEDTFLRLTASTEPRP
ncbi:MAG: ABC transporter ATP-binding protein [Candidatus Omnitrophota bacterium]